MERLTERIDDVPDGESGVWVKEHDYVSAAEKLAEYEDLEEQGRLIKLPCKVGTNVYYILGIPNETPCTIESCVFKLSDIYKIGKSLFLTKSEAEAKMKELRGKEDGSME